MKVLFCTDGSEASYYALHKAIKFIKKDSSIDVLTVLDWGFFPTYVSFPEEEEMYPAYDLAKSILEETEKIINSYEYAVGSQEYLTGSPVDIILNKLKDGNYDLLVLGSHGKKGLKNWLGSVSRKVVTKADIPVLIARPPKEKEIVTIKPKNKILLTSDGSTNSYIALEKYAKLFEHSDQEITILTVVPGAESFPLEIAMDNEWLESCLSKQEEIAQEVLDKSKSLLNQNNLCAQTLIMLKGDAAEEIKEYSEKEELDLIVMGSHGREGFSDFLLGSVSKRVLDNSFIPVCIIPTKKK